MSVMFECGDTAALVSYLYGECDPAERAAAAAHLAVCPACTAELAALGATRMQLASWTPPEAQLGFRVVSDAPAAAVLRPARWWHQPMPIWVQAAAAVALFGVGLSFGVMRGTARDGLDPSPGAMTSAQLAPAVSHEELAALEQRLRDELNVVRTSVAGPRAAQTGPAASETQLLARVRALIEESEMRQRRELALRTAEVVRDLDAQRQFDWARVQRALGQFEGTTGAEIQRQRQELNNLIRVSQRPQ